MKNKNICPICGEPTLKFYGNYRKDGLCAKHGKQANDNQIEQCTDCEKWHESGKDCECKHKTQIKTIIADELNCIVCGKPSCGRHYCYSCYTKYKDKSITVKITNCTDFEVIDEYGNLKYTCEDGRKVRSKSELIISNFLFLNKIRAVYEKEIYYKENGEDKKLKPDFYLPDYDMYIEHNGFTGEKYIKAKEYSENKYSELNFKVIVTSEKDLENIAACLKPKLNLH